VAIMLRLMLWTSLSEMEDGVGHPDSKYRWKGVK